MIFSAKYSERVDYFVAVVLLAAVVYVALGWTPSSYGTVLKIFGADGVGLVAGTPRDIRTDESHIATPNFQIAVNNGFKRFNSTSPYGEDLRNFIGLPLADWGLAFKPYFWPFFFAPPWYAFSFYHAFFIVLFLLGYYFLFVRLGFDKAMSALASVAMFFSLFVQAWWTTYGPVVGGFPWFLLVAIAQMDPVFKAILLTYTTAAWLLAHLYPPLMISLAFVAILLLVGFRPHALHWKNILVMAVGMSVGAAVATIYLFDVIPIMAQTIYPGHRISGGGGVPAGQWLSQFFPFFPTKEFESLLNRNICEVSTVGSYVALLGIVFTDHRALVSDLVRKVDGAGRFRRHMAILLLGFGLTSIWELFPVPTGIGRILLWDRIPAGRMLFASGFLLFVASLVLVSATTLRITWLRFVWISIFVLGAWIASKQWLLGGHLSILDSDLWVLLPLALLVSLRGYIPPQARSAALVACATVANAVGFGLFNPIQEAWPIFQRPKTAIADCLNVIESLHSQNWLVIAEDIYGYSILNGWGFRSVSHTLIAPQLAFFRQRFPEGPKQEFERVFNNYGHIWPSDIDRPFRTGLASFVPIRVFHPIGPAVALKASAPRLFPLGGYIDDIGADPVSPMRLRVVGWGQFDLAHPGVRLQVHTNLPVTDAEVSPIVRREVTQEANRNHCTIRGFQMSLRLSRPVDRELAQRSICLISEDPGIGTFTLNNPAAPDACRELARSSSTHP